MLTTGDISMLECIAYCIVFSLSYYCCQGRLKQKKDSREGFSLKEPKFWMISRMITYFLASGRLLPAQICEYKDLSHKYYFSDYVQVSFGPSISKIDCFISLILISLSAI